MEFIRKKLPETDGCVLYCAHMNHEPYFRLLCVVRVVRNTGRLTGSLRRLDYRLPHWPLGEVLSR